MSLTASGTRVLSVRWVVAAGATDLRSQVVKSPDIILWMMAVGPQYTCCAKNLLNEVVRMDPAAKRRMLITISDGHLKKDGQDAGRALRERCVRVIASVGDRSGSILVPPPFYPVVLCRITSRGATYLLPKDVGTQTDNHLRELLLITGVEVLTKESSIGDRGLPTMSTRRQNPSQREILKPDELSHTQVQNRPILRPEAFEHKGVCQGDTKGLIPVAYDRCVANGKESIIAYDPVVGRKGVLSDPEETLRRTPGRPECQTPDLTVRPRGVVIMRALTACGNSRQLIWHQSIYTLTQTISPTRLPELVEDLRAAEGIGNYTINYDYSLTLRILTKSYLSRRIELVQRVNAHSSRQFVARGFGPHALVVPHLDSISSRLTVPTKASAARSHRDLDDLEPPKRKLPSRTTSSRRSYLSSSEEENSSPVPYSSPRRATGAERLETSFTGHDFGEHSRVLSSLPPLSPPTRTTGSMEQQKDSNLRPMQAGMEHRFALSPMGDLVRGYTQQDPEDVSLFIRVTSISSKKNLVVEDLIDRGVPKISQPTSRFSLETGLMLRTERAIFQMQSILDRASALIRDRKTNERMLIAHQTFSKYQAEYSATRTEELLLSPVSTNPEVHELLPRKEGPLSDVNYLYDNLSYLKKYWPERYNPQLDWIHWVHTTVCGARKL
ncbi:hypothetical protein B0H16DRAFT_1452976 [Mycena metata]|uniref:Uncharacterized protein n=1 Tax=Mycena metata TaxID=1033252 RepID=A0AAD7JNY0_9AGAR|nr:hypothetical protein B0H16DRAFT_1452976 [Mycena metata]